MTAVKFSHCNHDEKHLSLHDCIAERAYLENGKLGFELNDGFWISPDHPESGLPEWVRTDFSKVEFTPEYGEDDVTVYVFRNNRFRKTIRTEWTVRDLVNKINSGTYRLEFLYQYVAYHAFVLECELRSDRKPYFQECVIKISASDVGYYWNELCKDKPW